MEKIIESGKIKSILKKILIENNCSFGKYMSKVECFNPKSDSLTECFITPLVTISKKKVLILTKVVYNNWYDSVQGLEGIINYLSRQYNIKAQEYEIILHAYFIAIDLEQYYTMEFANEMVLNKLSIGGLEVILK